MKIVRVKILKTPHETEWVVKAYTNNAQHLPFQRYPDADYFTNNKQDAIETAKLMMEGK